MKKTIFSIALLLFSTFATVPLKASTPQPFDFTTKAVQSSDNDTIIIRTEEIKAFGKSSFSPSEKKQVRKEKRATKKQRRLDNGGIYISVGALLIVILLLILLL